MKEFKGRVVLGGKCEGEAIVSKKGFNLLASFQKSALNKDKVAICNDQNNGDLFGKIMTDRILCLPQTIGSTTGGMVLQTSCQMGIGPKAMLFSEHIDSLAAAGVILSEVWVEKRIITIDQLGKDFLEAVQTGDKIEIYEDGTVIIK